MSMRAQLLWVQVLLIAARMGYGAQRHSLPEPVQHFSNIQLGRDSDHARCPKDTGQEELAIG